MSTIEVAPVEQEQEKDLNTIAHAYCGLQTLWVPELPPQGYATAWCGFKKTSPWQNLGRCEEKDYCVVCSDLIAKRVPCPHCGMLPT